MQLAKTLLAIFIATAAGTACANEIYTVAYQCQAKKRVTVKYTLKEATTTAQVKLHGKNQTLVYSDASNEDSAIYKAEPYSLAMQNGKNFGKNALIYIAENKNTTVNGKTVNVDNMLYKDCTPRSVKKSRNRQ